MSSNITVKGREHRYIMQWIATFFLMLRMCLGFAEEAIKVYCYIKYQRDDDIRQ